MSKKPTRPKIECVASCCYLNSFCSQTSGVTGSAESIDLSCIHVSTTNVVGFNDSLYLKYINESNYDRFYKIMLSPYGPLVSCKSASELFHDQVIMQW